MQYVVVLISADAQKHQEKLICDLYPKSHPVPWLKAQAGGIFEGNNMPK